MMTEAVPYVVLGAHNDDWSRLVKGASERQQGIGSDDNAGAKEGGEIKTLH